MDIHQMTHPRRMIIAAALAVGLAGATVAASPPETVHYEGALTQPGGSGLPLGAGDYAMRFRLFTMETGGSEVWTEVREGGDPVTGAVTVAPGGHFAAELGSVTGLLPTLVSAESLWLEISVDLNQDTVINELDEVYSPRQRLTSVPFALVSRRSLTADSIGAANLLSVARTGGDFTAVSDALASLIPTPDDPVTIFVAPGSYTDAFVVPSHTRIVGSGPGQTIITAPGSSAGQPTTAMIDSAEGVSISGLTLIGEDHAVFTLNGSEATFTNLVVETTSGDGFRIIGAGSDVVIRDCHIRQAGARGINVDQTPMRRILVEDCLVENTGGAENPLLGGDGGVGTMNTTYRNTTFRHINANQALLLEHNGATVTGCVIEDCPGRGILINAATLFPAEETRIEDTLIRRVGVGVRVSDQSPGGHATVENCTVASAASAGIRGEGGTTVRGCTFTNCPVAIEITNTSSRAVMIGNEILPRAGASSGGITLGAGVDVLLTRNIFESATVDPSASVVGGDNLTPAGSPLGIP